MTTIEAYGEIERRIMERVSNDLQEGEFEHNLAWYLREVCLDVLQNQQTPQPG